jgi:hypothetical protein
MPQFYWKPRTNIGTPERTLTATTPAGDLGTSSVVIGQTDIGVIVEGYIMHNKRMAATMTATEEDATTEVGGSKEDGGVVVGHTTAAYL